MVDGSPAMLRDSLCRGITTSTLVLGRHLVGLIGLHDERVTRGAPLLQAMHDHHKAVCGGLRANVDAGILPAQQMLDEGSLPCSTGACDSSAACCPLTCVQPFNTPHSACPGSGGRLGIYKGFKVGA